jgi:aminobenzoyl-glutamate utilization protein B
VPAQTWQAVACAGSSTGIKGMVIAARAMALTAADLYVDPGIRVAAKEELERRRGGASFTSSTLAPPQPFLDDGKGKRVPFAGPSVRPAARRARRPDGRPAPRS